MTSQRRKGVIIGYVNIIAKNLVSLVYVPMLLHFVSQADYGVYQSSYSLVYSLTLLTFGFSAAYVRFYMRRKTGKDKGTIESLNGMYLVLYLIIAAVAIVIGMAFSANAGLVFSKGFTAAQVSTARILMMIMTVNIACTLFSTVFDSYIVAHERFTFQQSRQLFTTLASPCLSLLLLYLGMGTVGVSLAQLTITLILLFLNARFSIGTLGMRFDVRHRDKGLFKAIAVFSGWIFANQVCELINQNVPNIMLGALSGAADVAVFAIAVNIRAVFYSLSGTIAGVFTPLVNRIVATDDNNRELTKLMTRVGRVQMLVLSYVFGGFILLGRFFVAKWAGEEYSQAYWLVIVMVTPLIIPEVQNVGIEIQKAKNKHRTRSIVYLVMAGVNLTITVVLAPTLGCWAPAIGYATYITLGTVLFMNWYYQTHIGLDMFYFWRRVLPIVAVAAACTALCYGGTILLPVDSWSVFILWGLIYTALIAPAFYRFALTKEERAIVKNRVMRKLGRSPIEGNDAAERGNTPGKGTGDAAA